MDTEKMKETVKVMLQAVGVFLGAAVAVQALIFLMWACYYAGIPM